MRRVARSAIVAHGAAQLFALVEDIERYPQFLPWCTETAVKSRTPAVTVATITLGVRGMRQSFTTENSKREPEAIDLRLVEGPFRHFNAAWRFRQLGSDACKVEFSMEYEFSSRALALILQPLFDRLADSMVEAFTKRADQVYGAAH